MATVALPRQYDRVRRWPQQRRRRTWTVGPRGRSVPRGRHGGDARYRGRHLPTARCGVDARRRFAARWRWVELRQPTAWWAQGKGEDTLMGLVLLILLLALLFGGLGFAVHFLW